MSELTEYLAAAIAEARAKKAREALRPKLLQRAQLDGGRLIEDDEGVMEELEPCPVCRGEGICAVPAPFGLEAGEMAQPSVVRREKIPDDTLLWAVKSGLLKLSVDTKVFDVFADDASPESAYHMSIIGSSLTPRSTDVLRVMSPDKVKELLG